MNAVETQNADARSLLVDDQRVEELKQEAIHLPSWDLNFRQIWDSELLLNGAFSPLTGYLGQADYERVCSEMRLASEAVRKRGY